MLIAKKCQFQHQQVVLLEHFSYVWLKLSLSHRYSWKCLGRLPFMEVNIVFYLSYRFLKRKFLYIRSVYETCKRAFCSEKLLKHSCPSRLREVPPWISKVVTKNNFLIVALTAFVALLPMLCTCWQNCLNSLKSMNFASILYGL